MNVVQTVVDRQLGLYTRPSYECALRRLAVREADSFLGLSNCGGGGLHEDSPVFACRFADSAPYRHVLALANEDGRVALQDTSKARANTTLEGFQCHNNAVFDLAWRPQHLGFVTASGDHTACLWDASCGTPQRVQVCSGHTRSVKTITFSAHPAVFASGARDGRVLLWDLRAPAVAAVLQPDNCLSDCHSGFAPAPVGRRREARAASVTALVFHGEHALVSCGECDGNVKVWDLRKNYSVYRREPLPKHAFPYCGSSTRRGYTSLALDEASSRLYASCMDNVIYCFDVSTYRAAPVQRYIGHENGTFYVKASLSSDGRHLASGSSDARAYIWDVRCSQPLVRLPGHRAEVTCAAWAHTPGRGPTLATCGDDARHKLWRVAGEDQGGERAEEVPRAEMASLPFEATPASLKLRDTTPTSLKRRRDGTPGSRKSQLGGCKSKRCLADMLGGREANYDQANHTTPTKRCKLELTESSPKPGPSTTDAPTVNVSLTDVPTPVKVSPKSPKVRILTIRTPTKNLPNFVLSGEAPHLRLMSPVKKREKENGDWLTRLRASRPAPPVFAPLSPGDTSRPKVKPGPKTGTLLKYFDVKRDKK